MHSRPARQTADSVGRSDEVACSIPPVRKHNPANPSKHHESPPFPPFPPSPPPPTPASPSIAVIITRAVLIIIILPRTRDARHGRAHRLRGSTATADHGNERRRCWRCERRRDGRRRGGRLTRRRARRGAADTDIGIVGSTVCASDGNEGACSRSIVPARQLVLGHLGTAPAPVAGPARSAGKMR